MLDNTLPPESEKNTNRWQFMWTLKWHSTVNKQIKRFVET